LKLHGLFFVLWDISPIIGIFHTVSAIRIKSNRSSEKDLKG
jgi:hypothetical protein